MNLPAATHHTHRQSDEHKMTILLKIMPFLGLVLFSASPLRAQELPTPWKHQDIGAAQVRGSAAYSAGVFTLQGTMDIWGPADGCHIAWQPLRGDGELAARVVAIENPGGVAHAKASLAIRESLEPGARSVTMCVTATDGSQFLYRDKTNGKTTRVYADAVAETTGVPKAHFPFWMKLVRRGNEFSGYESADGEKWLFSGRIKLDLAANAIVGLAASSHKADVLTKVTFDRVKLSPQSKNASSQRTQKRISQLATIAIDGSGKQVVYQTSQHIEAPNRSPDGRRLVFNNSWSSDSKHFAFVMYPEKAN
jgi:hypothetical protein